MDTVSVLGEQHNKKTGRHRKKQLYSSILNQMEFYFSTSNLSKDRFLSQLLAEDEYVDLNVFLSFNKIKKLTENIEDLRKALGKSDLVELSEDKNKVRRKQPLKVKNNVDECTIYVENIKADADHDWVTSIFSEHGKVVYVSIPKYKESRSNKGFAFVEFDTEAEANNALEFFESIGCRMPSQINPEELKSIATFEGDGTNDNHKPHNMDNEQENNNKKRKFSEEGEDQQTGKKQKNKDVDDTEQQEECSNKKRKLSEEEDEHSDKKQKKNDESETETTSENSDNKMRKKLKKEHKKKNLIKEIGLQVLSKKEWKKMRNKYLDLQKKKMKEFKQHLYRMRFAPKPTNPEKPKKVEVVEDVKTKFEFKPGLIVKLKLEQPCEDPKKLKNELKSSSSDIQYVEIPVTNAGEEVYIRFGNEKSAQEFCKVAGPRKKYVLTGDEESQYWDKINNDRNVKFAKSVKKQRGRDKLLKKAKEAAHHIRFDDHD